MEAKSQVEALEADIREIIHHLLDLDVTPHVRELRAKAVTYGRVIGGWGLYPPTEPQLQAMCECVQELRIKVNGTKRDARDATSSRTPSARGSSRANASRAPSSSAGALSSAPGGSGGPGLSKGLPPPMPVESDPFAAALRADEVENTGVRTRGMRPPAPTLPSAPPVHVPSSRPPRRASVSPAPPSRAATVAPSSRKRPASDTRPTPVPALLQTRRSR